MVERHQRAIAVAIRIDEARHEIADGLTRARTVHEAPREQVLLTAVAGVAEPRMAGQPFVGEHAADRVESGVKR
jgi:hypothetical protein